MDRTIISSTNVDAIKYRNMSPRDIVQFLETEALQRSFKDVLFKVYPHEDVAKILPHKLVESSGGES